MFFKKRKQEEIEKQLNEIKLEKEKLEKEKQQLLKIKEIFENTNNPDYIDISNTYIWDINGIKNIVRLEEYNIMGTTIFSQGRDVPGYKSILIDIFTEKEIYSQCNIHKIEREIYIHGSDLEKGIKTLYGYLYPIYEEDRSLLEYPNKKVPRYVMYQTFYKINNVNIGNFKEDVREIKMLEKK